MLELKHVTKIYRTKAGETRALDDVSLVFPEKGMVFILGKSGSGKSTLLNLCGGLDSPDDGEIIVKGKSTKDFTPTDFDSYRNTFIGFIFQEYNILNEFNVEENVALALELQGKSRSPELITQILRQVDLEDCAKRKPNTLSGGQKQRVAIARALVKNPEIIMADEPSGALDSATGKQVFDTLKKLSEDKLVIIVSHDREFAELYADRIIELKDGRIISDMTRTTARANDGDSRLTFINDDTVLVKKGSKLENEDFEKLNAFLSSASGDVLVSRNAEAIRKYRQSANISDEGAQIVFKNTACQPTPGDYSPRQSEFIKSRLPLRRAIKIGASGLKIKPLRFAFTVILCVVALALFGMFSAVMTYDRTGIAIKTLTDSREQYMGISKTYLYKNTVYGNGESKSEEYFSPALYSDDDLTALTQKYGDEIIALYNVNAEIVLDYKTGANDYLYLSAFGAAEKSDLTYTLGRAPSAKGEVSLSEYVYNKLLAFAPNGVKDYADIGFTVHGVPLTCCGVYRTPYSVDDFNSRSDISYYFALNDNFYNSCVISKDTYEAMTPDEPDVPYDNTLGDHFDGNGLSAVKGDEYSIPASVDINRVYKLNSLSRAAVVGVDGKEPADGFDGIAVNYSAWKSLYSSAVRSAVAADPYLNGLFNDTADGYSMAQKFEALNTGKFTDGGGQLIGTPQTLIKELFAFLAEHSVIDDYRVGFWEKTGKKATSAVIGAVVYDAATQDMNCAFVPAQQYEALRQGQINVSGGCTEYTSSFDYSDGDYRTVLIPVANNKTLLTSLITQQDITDANGVSYTIVNETYGSVTSVSDTVSILSSVFLGAGIGFAVLAALLLFNFISASIADKKREIGILRAVGAKGSDVFKIFLSESFIIALICSIAALILTGIGCAVANSAISQGYGMTFSLFTFNIATVLMVIGLALLTALISTVIPVYSFSKKKPVDTIRDL